jgi:hypothetical protein
MAKIINTKNCSYRVCGVYLTPEYGELEIGDERAKELCQLDGIEIVSYDEVEVPVLSMSDAVDSVEPPSPPVSFYNESDEDTKTETPRKKRGRRSKAKKK